MQRRQFLATLIAVGLAACSKKEEPAPAPAPAPVVDAAKEAAQKAEEAAKQADRRDHAGHPRHFRGSECHRAREQRGTAVAGAAHVQGQDRNARRDAGYGRAETAAVLRQGGCEQRRGHPCGQQERTARACVSSNVSPPNMRAPGTWL